MRVLLIGGNGFIGLPLTNQLRAAGHEVALFHRGQPRSDNADRVIHIFGDRNRLPEYSEQLRSFAPDVIIDLILSSVQQARALMNVARGVTRRVIAISSGDVYRAWGLVQGVEAGEFELLPITEDSALRTTRKLYSPEMIRAMQSVAPWATEDYDKIGVEEAVMSNREVPGTVLRLPMVYGPGDRAHRLFLILKQVADGSTSISVPEDLAEWRAPRGYVENVAHAIVLAATSDRAAGRIYNVCEDPCLSELEWQTSVARLAGWSGEIIKVPVELAPEHLRFKGNVRQHLVISSQRIRSELEYGEIVSREEGLRRTIAWEQGNP
jgi:nucleoside-diphosphate-sugar epimerase